ncbi:MAG: tetratricopeptide repeat protein [candidate division Zixibacteria bacterium]|nr:tetratricopeptide repeat protein [candidate division Zixibacteria bacterium]
METIVIVFLLALIALIFIYAYYDRFKREKMGKDPAKYIEGLKALLNSQDDLAFSKFREAVAEDSDNVDAYVRIGNILRKYGKSDKALQVHKDLTIRHGLTIEDKKIILSALADDFLAQGDSESALTAANELLSLDEDNRWAVEKLLEIYTQLENWEEAYNFKGKLIKLDGGKSNSSLAIYKFLQGEKLYNEKEYHRARILFKEAIGIDTHCVPAYIYIGDSYLAENREENAVVFWRKLIKEVPAASHFVLGKLKRALFDLGKFGEISSICLEILGVSPKNLAARLILAEFNYKKGEYSIAVEHLTAATDDHPDSYLPILDLAKLYLTIGDKKKLGELINRLEERRESVENEYHCNRCGHKSKIPKWLCPSCKAVDSFIV